MPKGVSTTFQEDEDLFDQQQRCLQSSPWLCPGLLTIFHHNCFNCLSLSAFVDNTQYEQCLLRFLLSCLLNVTIPNLYLTSVSATLLPKISILLQLRWQSSSGCITVLFLAWSTCFTLSGLFGSFTPVTQFKKSCSKFRN